ncbi:MAG: membrane protein insertion efficiency factor YidD [Verrucomicrobia bacterium]|nr:membrane protein insertion efficiency factor YidD [Verrucomicrobiota bacterium]
MMLLQASLCLIVRGYQKLISPMLVAIFGPAGFGCRYQPTCSHYALEALRVHGACTGTWLTCCRICRCHPWGGQGFDPVPASNRPVHPSDVGTEAGPIS